MSTNKFFLLIAGSLLSLSVCAVCAVAETTKPEAYQSLTAVEIQPGAAPALVAGLSDLGPNERRYSERLPVQLDGAIKKVNGSRYQYKAHKPHKSPKVKKSKVKKVRF